MYQYLTLFRAAIKTTTLITKTWQWTQRASKLSRNWIYVLGGKDNLPTRAVKDQNREIVHGDAQKQLAMALCNLLPCQNTGPTLGAGLDRLT